MGNTLIKNRLINIVFMEECQCLTIGLKAWLHRNFVITEGKTKWNSLNKGHKNGKLNHSTRLFTEFFIKMNRTIKIAKENIQDTW